MQLNEATLHAPITLRGKRLTEPCKALLLALLERDVAKRLSSAQAVKAHAFLGELVEWRLLAQQALPPPFVPNADLVYAKDDVPPISFHLDEGEQARDLDEVGARLGAWEYAVAAGSDEFGDELGEYVKKFTAESHA